MTSAIDGWSTQMSCDIASSESWQTDCRPSAHADRHDGLRDSARVISSAKRRWAVGRLCSLPYPAGLMFGLMRKKLLGSYFCFSATSRA
jgi:hypothetical protein